MKKLTILLFIFIFISLPAFAWDGYDYETGNYIEIEKGNLIKSGSIIEIYDYETNSYKEVEVQRIYNKEIEVYDYETDEYRTFEMN